MLSYLLLPFGANHRVSMSCRWRREAHGTSQVNTRRTRASGTRTYRLLLIMRVPNPLLIRLPSLLLLVLVPVPVLGHHLLLHLVLHRRGRTSLPPAASPPPIRRLLFRSRRRACSSVNQEHVPVTVAHYLCSITCN
jgi:hypothetical protein